MKLCEKLMTKTLKILNWNVEANKQTKRNKRSDGIKQILMQFEPDVICLTEAYPHNLPDVGHTITSAVSGWSLEQKGVRKVILWSKSKWDAVDTVGAVDLPQGRFVTAITEDIRIIGVVIPYHAYRMQTKWGSDRKAMWQGAEEYLVPLKDHVLSQPIYQNKTMILGDFNLQIPARGYPKEKSRVNQLREETFARYQIPTAGELDDPALDKPFIDHVALTSDIEVKSMQFISRFTSSGTELSDHNGVLLEIQV